MGLDLRWRTVVVTGAATPLGREVALRFGRVGAAVVAVDADAAGAEVTASQVRACRVQAWCVQADVGRADDLALLAGRLRDLGGADVLVTAPHRPTVQLFLDGLAARRGRRDDGGVVVLVGPGVRPLVTALTGARVPPRITAVADDDVSVAATVVDLAARGADGTVVGLSPGAAGAPPG